MTGLRTELARRVDGSLDRLIAVTRRLVAVASPNPPSDTEAIAKVAESLLREIPGIEVEVIEPAPRVKSLIGRIRSARPGRRLIFNGHLDTFPILEHLPWTVPPLGGVLKDGRLYGRGVCDMKGGMACSLLAAQLLAGHRDAWPGEIVLTLAGDEENMGSLGTGWMLEHIPHAKGDANICGDVGSPKVVRFGEKGLMWIEIEATGSPAHGAHVHKGPNAIDRERFDWDQRTENPFWCPDAQMVGVWEEHLETVRKAGSSTGAVVEVEALGVPPGWGAPIYGKLDAELAAALMSINASKGVEIGAGFASAAFSGEENADEMRMGNDGVQFLSNHAGGVLGGISSGAPIVARVAFKPTSSILTPVRSIDDAGGEIEMRTKGRHDPCVGIRAAPVVEAMVACVLADAMLRHRAQTGRAGPVWTVGGEPVDG